MTNWTISWRIVLTLRSLAFYSVFVCSVAIFLSFFFFVFFLVRLTTKITHTHTHLLDSSLTECAIRDWRILRRKREKKTQNAARELSKRQIEFNESRRRNKTERSRSLPSIWIVVCLKSRLPQKCMIAFVYLSIWNSLSSRLDAISWP